MRVTGWSGRNIILYKISMKVIRDTKNIQDIVVGKTDTYYFKKPCKINANRR